MRKSLSLLLVIGLVALVAYTHHGITQLGMQGGPCNAGIAFIVLIPSLLVCATLSVISLLQFISNKKKSSGESIALTAASFLLWTCWLYIFLEDDFKETLLCLGPFWLFNVLLLALLIWKRSRRKNGIFRERNNIYSP